MASLNWSYEGDNGPDQWHKLYPIANGNYQSPIDIKTKNVKKDPSLEHLHITWNLSTCKEIVNIGHSFHVNFEDKDNRSERQLRSTVAESLLPAEGNGLSDLTVVTGGPLTGNYRLHQFHFHWGQTDDYGSEHTVDGRKYASELHLVHWNSDKYSSFAEASNKPDGLAIIAVFLQVGPPHESVQKIVTALGLIKTKGKKAPFTNFDPSTLLPGSLDYWTYAGSLTHPPLLESVTWVIFKEPITVSSEQLAQFRCLTVTNHRLAQPLKGRQVRT